MAPPTTATELARRFRVDIDTGFPGPANWVQLTGVTDFKPAVDPTLQSSADYDSDWEGSEKTKLKLTAEVTYLVKKNISDDQQNPGHQVMVAKETLFGEQGFVHIRWYDRNGGPEAYEAYVWAKLSRANSGDADLDAVSAEFTDVGQGRIPIANPSA